MTSIWPRYHHTAHIFLTVVGMAGILGLFLPDSADGTIWIQILGTGWFGWLYAPLVLPIPIAIGCVRLLLSSRFSTSEKIITYCFGIAGLCTGIYGLFIYQRLARLCMIIGLFPEIVEVPLTALNWTAILMPSGIMFIGCFWFRRNTRDSLKRVYGPVMFLQIPYLAYAAFLVLTGSFDIEYTLQIGEYLILIASLSYLTQMTLVTSQPGVGK